MENRSNRFRHKQFRSIDRLLIKLTTSAVVLLLVTQAFMLNGETRKHLSQVDKLEGEQITAPATMYAADVPWPDESKNMNVMNKVVAKSMRSFRPSEDIVIRMINPPANPDAVVNINGESVGNFSRGRIEITIYDGDYLEIDASKVKQHAQFIIDARRKRLVYPVDGIMLESQANIVTIGKVVFKH